MSRQTAQLALMLPPAEPGTPAGRWLYAALRAAILEGRIRPGSLLLLVTFGAGFTWGSAVVRW